MSLIFPKKEILYAPMLGTLGGGSARGFGRGGIGDLYDFSSFIFYGLDGEEEYRGITYSDATSQYQSYNPNDDWFMNTANFNITTRGYQLWTVPADGNYRFEAKGAMGGYSTWGSTSSPYRGKGGMVIGRFDLLKGDVVTIACGHKGHTGGSDRQASGGGGTFVVMDGGNYSSASLSQILLIAGGGGGGFGNNSADGNDSHGGNTGTLHYGGSSQQYSRQTSLGAGGRGGRLSDGGGGFLSNGNSLGTADDVANHGFFGYSYRAGLEGGAGNTGPHTHACSSGGTALGTLYGGFGGGGGGSYAANGAGGGFTGGSGSNGCDQGGAGGGANYVNTSHSNFTGGQSYSAGNNGARGQVEVVRMS